MLSNEENFSYVLPVAEKSEIYLFSHLRGGELDFFTKMQHNDARATPISIDYIL